MLSHETPVGLAWDTVHAFLRITTNPRILRRPLPIDDAIAIVRKWLQSPSFQILSPGPKYSTILSDLLTKTQIRGPGVSDAQLAALAIEHDALLCTADRDFRRFEELRFENPLVRDPA